MSTSGTTTSNPPSGADGAALPELPGLPRDAGGGPVFAEPWQAEAFAITLRLHEAGLFTWPEWAARLAAAITAAQEAGDPDRGDTYYHHWLAALERLVTDKGLVGRAELTGRKEAWARAARATPHGRPIELTAARQRRGAE